MNFANLVQKATSTAKEKVTLVMMTIVALREQIKVTPKEKEDGSVELKITLGITPLKVLPTKDGKVNKFTLLPADLVPTKEAAIEEAIKVVMDQAKTGAFDVELAASQKLLAETAVKTKATREAKKAAKAADTVTEATGTLPEGL